MKVLVCADRRDVGSLFGVMANDNIQRLDYLLLGAKQLAGMAGGEIVHKLRYSDGARWLKADLVSLRIWSRVILVFHPVCDSVFLLKFQFGFAQNIGLEVGNNVASVLSQVFLNE